MTGHAWVHASGVQFRATMASALDGMTKARQAADDDRFAVVTFEGPAGYVEVLVGPCLPLAVVADRPAGEARGGVHFGVDVRVDDSRAPVFAPQPPRREPDAAVRYQVAQIARVLVAAGEGELGVRDLHSLNRSARILARLALSVAVDRALVEGAVVAGAAGGIVDADAEVDEDVAQVPSSGDGVGAESGQEAVGLVEQPADGSLVARYLDEQVFETGDVLGRRGHGDSSEVRGGDGVDAVAASERTVGEAADVGVEVPRASDGCTTAGSCDSGPAGEVPPASPGRVRVEDVVRYLQTLGVQLLPWQRTALRHWFNVNAGWPL